MVLSSTSEVLTDLLLVIIIFGFIIDLMICVVGFMYVLGWVFFFGWLISWRLVAR